jgi:hypothetical protein
MAGGNTRDGAMPMNDTSITTATLDQTDEEILAITVSDEALEAAAGSMERGKLLLPSIYPVCSTAGRYCGVGGE